MGGFNMLDILNEKSVKSNLQNVENNNFDLQYIDVDKIEFNERNFYNTDEIEELKETIKVAGLQHNILVKDLGKDRYRVISGHRRMIALKELISQGELSTNKVPCKVISVAELEERLLLVTLNSTAREITPHEKMLQVKEVTEIAREMKQADKSLYSGKLIDYLANILNMSSSEIGRYQKIEKDLGEELKSEFKNGNISTDVAYEVARLDEDKQKEVRKIIREKVANNEKITKSEVKKISDTDVPKLGTEENKLCCCKVCGGINFNIRDVKYFTKTKSSHDKKSGNIDIEIVLTDEKENSIIFCADCKTAGSFRGEVDVR